MIRWLRNFLPVMVIHFCFIQDHSSRDAAHVHVNTVGNVCFMCFVSGSLWLKKPQKTKQKKHLCVVSLLLRLFLVKSWTQVQSGQNHFCLSHLWAEHVCNNPQQQDPNLTCKNRYFNCVFSLEARGNISVLLSEFHRVVCNCLVLIHFYIFKLEIIKAFPTVLSSWDLNCFFMSSSEFRVLAD